MQLGGELYLKGFSREQEFQADTLGVRYMVRAGYNPQAQSTFLRTLSGHNVLERELAGREGRDPLEDFFATHPRTEDRVLKAIAAAQVSGADGGAPLCRDRYLEKVTGLLFGDDPEQGLVRGRTFAHAGLGFTFKVPSGYRLINTQKAVYAKGPENSLIKFDVERKRTASDIMSYLAQTWGRGLALADVERISVNGLAAATGHAPIRSKGQPADIRLVAVRFSADAIYRFMMVTPLRVEPHLRTELQRTTYSFRRLSADEAAEFRPFRLAVITVQPGDSVQSLAARMPFEDYQAARFQSLNGLPQNAQLTPGQRVKIVTD